MHKFLEPHFVVMSLLLEQFSHLSNCERVCYLHSLSLTEYFVFDKHLGFYELCILLLLEDAFLSYFIKILTLYWSKTTLPHKYYLD